ncbi:MAG: molybdopterin molybdotransferase MoeA [Alphaproteobacteria bacterium]|nr:molybdopterin molybdotransferase MoeA [Alphaproteobacteria bacterium]
MTRQTADCFAVGDRLLGAAEALELIAERVVAVTEAESVPLGQALGRVLAADLIAGFDVPPHDNAAVDGFALRLSDLAADRPTRLPVAGRAAAGRPPVELAPGSATRIFTGAVLPVGADAIVMQEHAREADGWVEVPQGLEPFANCRRAGEDVRQGEAVLRRGHRLRPQDLGLAAELGRARLQVHRPLRVAVFSSGDELRQPGEALAPGAVYDANRFLLIALLEELGAQVSDRGILADRAEPVRQALAEAARDQHLILTSGGVSMGEEDHLRAAVEALGRLHFWRLAIKPGRPLAVGQLGGAAFCGLPGNPVAAMVCFLRFARPLALRLAGASAIEPHAYPLPAGFAFRKRAGRREWLRARIVRGQDGAVSLERFAREGSGILTSLVAADGLVELPEDLTDVRPGDLVAFLPFYGMCG